MIINQNSPQGNAFAIMGAVSKLLKQTGRAAELDAVMAEMQSGDYDNLCKVAERVSHGSIKVR